MITQRTPAQGTAPPIVEGSADHPIGINDHIWGPKVVAAHWTAKNPIAIIESLGIGFNSGETIAGGFVVQGPNNPTGNPFGYGSAFFSDIFIDPTDPTDANQFSVDQGIIPDPQSGFFKDDALWIFPAAVVDPTVLVTSSTISGGGFTAIYFISLGVNATYHTLGDAISAFVSAFGRTPNYQQIYDVQGSDFWVALAYEPSDSVSVFRAKVRQTFIVNFAHVKNLAGIIFTPNIGWLPIQCNVTIKVFPPTTTLELSTSDGKISAFVDPEKRVPAVPIWSANQTVALNDSSLSLSPRIPQTILNGNSNEILVFNKKGIVYPVPPA